MRGGVKLKRVGFFWHRAVLADADGVERRVRWERVPSEVWGDDRMRAVVRLVRMRFAVEADHSGAMQTFKRVGLVVFGCFVALMGFVIAGYYLLVLPALAFGLVGVLLARRVAVRTAKRKTPVDWIAPLCLRVGVCPVCFEPLRGDVDGRGVVECARCRSVWRGEMVAPAFVDAVPALPRTRVEKEKLAYQLMRKRLFLSEDALGGRCLIAAVLPGDRSTLDAGRRGLGMGALARASRWRRFSQLGIFALGVVVLVVMRVFGSPSVSGLVTPGLIGAAAASSVPLLIYALGVRGAPAGAMRGALLGEGLCACCSDALVPVDEESGADGDAAGLSYCPTCGSVWDERGGRAAV